MARKRNTHSEISIVKLSAYKQPKIIEVHNKEWILYGEKNNYYKYLSEMYLNSPTNNAIINSVALQVVGAGLNSTQKASKANEWTEVISLVEIEDLPKIAMDLKLNGGAAFQCVKKKGEYKRLYHFPVETLRAEKAEDDEIKGYYYHQDWANIKPSEKPKRFSAFGFGGKDEIEILFIKPYVSGYFYYSPVDYQASLPYAQAEWDIAKYHVNKIQKGFSGNTLINFNNGVPETDEIKQKIEADVKRKFEGVEGESIIVAFNDDKDRAASIEDVSLANPHELYNFLSEEARQKIMLGHRVVSPMLYGIKENTGLGNNADELKTAMKLTDSVIFNPYRKLIIDAIQKVLKAKNINISLYFESLNPFKEEDVANADTTQMHTHLKDERPYLDDTKANLIIKGLDDLGNKGEDLEDYELIDEQFSEDEGEGDDLENYLNEWAKSKIKPTFMSRVKSFLGDANSDSFQDTDFFKVRYVYAHTSKDNAKGSSRPLCSKLMKDGLIYRKEEILNMSSEGGAEAQGESYSVWKYKGGANCQHGWLRKVYKKKAKKDGTAWGGGAMNGVTNYDVDKAIKEGALVAKRADSVGYKAPRDTKTKGYKK